MINAARPHGKKADILAAFATDVQRKTRRAFVVLAGHGAAQRVINFDVLVAVDTSRICKARVVSTALATLRCATVAGRNSGAHTLPRSQRNVAVAGRASAVTRLLAAHEALHFGSRARRLMVQAQRAQQSRRDLAVDANSSCAAAAGARALAAVRWELVAGDVEAHPAAAASATVTRAVMNEQVFAVRNPLVERVVRLVIASAKLCHHAEAAHELGTCQVAAARVQLLRVVTCGGVAFPARGVSRVPLANRRRWPKRADKCGRCGSRTLHPVRRDP